MKYLYHNDELRAAVQEAKDICGKYLKLSIEKKHTWWVFVWWTRESWIDIEVDNYWGYIPGDKMHGGHMTLHYQFGGEREVWPPDIFNLKSRMQDLINEYLKAVEQMEIKEKATLKQLSTV